MSRLADRPALRELSAQLEALRNTPAFANYLHVRERVFEMSMAATDKAGAQPSLYWREELDSFQYMLDASPLIIAKLRQHCHHLTGIRVYDYGKNRDDGRRILEEKVRALCELGADDLLVPEPGILGGFGFEVDGGMYNVDTLKYIEASLALKRGGILPILRDAGKRLTVWEIGGGWGGYAHHFKSLFPDATYIITDFPEVLLFSATYLMTAFPDAVVRFHIPGEGVDAFRDLDGADFVFASNAGLEETQPEHLDLTVNTISFQEMTTEQVREYVSHAHELGCPYLYSFNRERSNYNPELDSVSEAIRERYWAHEVLLLPGSYTKPLPPDWREPPSELKPQRYKHVVAWRRMLP